MRARLALLVAVLAVPAATLAQAPYYYPPPRADRGLNLGARIGYGAPFGDLSSDTQSVGSYVPGKLPIWLELGYRMNRVFILNLFTELSPAWVDSSFCTPGTSCSASDYRIGVDGQFHFAAHAPIDPWFGVGIGVEWLNTHTFDGQNGVMVHQTWSGWEFPILEGGLDLAASPNFTFGPFVSLSFGQYTHLQDSELGSTSLSTASHGWLEIGVKGTFKL